MSAVANESFKVFRDACLEILMHIRGNASLWSRFEGTLFLRRSVGLPFRSSDLEGYFYLTSFEMRAVSELKNMELKAHEKSGKPRLIYRSASHDRVKIVLDVTTGLESLNLIPTTPSTWIRIRLLEDCYNSKNEVSPFQTLIALADWCKKPGNCFQLDDGSRDPIPSLEELVLRDLRKRVPRRNLMDVNSQSTGSSDDDSSRDRNSSDYETETLDPSVEALGNLLRNMTFNST